METLSTILVFLLIIGVLVFVHELGHFLAARWTGTRADVFAVGMGPRMVGWNPKSGLSFGSLPPDLKLEGQTDYRLCWLPIGGYVKIVGMVDESFDTANLDSAPQPYEFRSKNALQKAFMLVAGVTMNFLLAVVVFWGIAWFVGETEHQTTRVGFVMRESPFYEAGLLPGDEITQVNDVAVTTWEGLVKSIAIPISEAKFNLTVMRAGEKLHLEIAASRVYKTLATYGMPGIFPGNRTVKIGDVLSFSPAEKAGIKQGDYVDSAGGIPISSFMLFRDLVRRSVPDGIGIVLRRAGTFHRVHVVPNPQDSTIGVANPIEEWDVPIIEIPYTFFEAGQKAVTDVGKTIVAIYNAIRNVFVGQATARETLGGPIQIARIAKTASDAGIQPLLSFMALISISLAVMNLLPLPGLDGGHLIFVLVEVTIRREIPTNIKLRIQQAGILLLILLMVFVLYLDVTR